MKIRQRTENGELGDFLQIEKTNLTLDDIKNKKILELSIERDQRLFAGFSSNVTEYTLHFGFDPVDQAYLQEKALLMTIDQSVISVDWKVRNGTEALFVTLTREQFFQVIKDAGLHKENLIRELMYLEAQVMNCETEEQVKLIQW